MTAAKVLKSLSGAQADFAVLLAADIPDISATYDAAGAAAAAQAASQPLDSDLTAFAGLAIAVDKLPYGTGSHTLGLADFSAAGRALVDDADAAAQRTTLGLGSLATQSGTFSGTSSGTNTGDQTRASLGLATSDSPQFAGIEVGAASDTTLARVSAGVLSVEGNALYAAGGTDVPVTDGGTGASTAAGARTNLGLVLGTDTAVPARFGRVKYGANTAYQLPGIIGVTTSTIALTVNSLLYTFQWTPTAIVIDQVAFNVTTGPASNANVRVGIYAADGDNQPSGAPLADVTVAVASAFTGVKTIAASCTIPAGPFLIAVNCDVAMTLRTWRGGPVGGFIDSGLGTNTQIPGGSVASTYGTMPNPGTAWTAVTSNVGDHPVVIRVLTA